MNWDTLPDESRPAVTYFYVCGDIGRYSFTNHLWTPSHCRTDFFPNSRSSNVLASGVRRARLRRPVRQLSLINTEEPLPVPPDYVRMVQPC